VTAPARQGANLGASPADLQGITVGSTPCLHIVVRPGRPALTAAPDALPLPRRNPSLAQPILFWGREQNPIGSVRDVRRQSPIAHAHDAALLLQWVSSLTVACTMPRIDATNGSSICGDESCMLQVTARLCTQNTFPTP
jgi:hypothetical protein